VAQIGNMARIPELRNRILFALGMLAIYRIGVQIPTPGVDPIKLQEFFSNQGGTIFGVFNMFTGGALERFSVFSLGIMPYISASIIFQLLAVTFPALEKIKKEGQQGQKRIQQYSRYLTIVLAIFQGFGVASLLQSQGLVIEPGLAFKIKTVFTLTAGTAFLMWLGEQITERGIGNGISLIIFAGIVAGLPGAINSTIELVRANQMSALFLLVLIIFMFVVTYFIVFFEQGQRRVPVQYAKRVVGRKMMQGQSTYLPLKVNMAGVIPPIFASSLLFLPATLAQFFDFDWIQKISGAASYGGWIFNTIQVVLIVFFCYFYTAIQFSPDDVADNMKKFGGYVPGIRPGKNTADYIERVLERLTLVGSVYLAVVCTLPVILQTKAGVSFYFGGTSLLIIVSVALDTMAQIEAHLMNHHYDGFLSAKSSRKLKARKG